MAWTLSHGISLPSWGRQSETSYTASIYTGDGDGQFSQSSTSPSIPFIMDINRPR